MMERKASLKLKKFKKESDKALWEQLMIMDFMSSEESDMDGDEDVLIVHSLPWRKPSVKKMFSTLDADISRNRSSQSRRQMKRRVMGSASERARPTTYPKWAVQTVE